MEGAVEGMQLPYVQSPEQGTDSTSRDCVGKTVTLQGNLDPCALYASEVTARSLCVSVFVSVHSHGSGYGGVYYYVCDSIICLSLPSTPLIPCEL